MCGIAGYLFDFSGTAISKTFGHETTLLSMLEMIRSRGPDSFGLWFEGSCGMVHSRLAINGHSGLDNQPLVSKSGRYVVSFNGEIYNYKELSDNFNLAADINCGDAYILTQLIDRVGIDRCLSVCEGMFAIAVYDVANGTITLARDRFGEKPLYYALLEHGRGSSGGSGIVFASTITALFKSGWIKPRQSLDAAVTFFAMGYCESGALGFDNILQVDPGTYVVFSLSAKQVNHQQNRFWNPLLFQTPRDAYDLSSSESLDSRITKTKTKIRQSISLACNAEVKQGVYLSGGIDSSLIAALSDRDNVRQAFTIDFQEGNSEIERSKLIADSLGFEHVVTTFGSTEFDEYLTKLYSAFSLPQSDLAVLPSICLGEVATSRGLKVCLSGEGGDEIFAGYSRYVAYSSLTNQRLTSKLIAHSLPFVKNFLKRSLVKKMLGLTAQNSMQFDKLGRSIGFALDGDFLKYYNSLVLPDSSRRLLTDEALERVKPKMPPLNIGTEDPISWMQLADVCSYLPSNLCIKSDAASMYSGLEVRQPFLNHRIFESAMNLPMNKKIYGGKGKVLLREMLSEALPGIKFGANKQGFNVPLNLFRSKSQRLEEGVEYLFNSDLNIFNIAYIEDLAKNVRSGFLGLEELNILWRAYSFRLWHEKYCE